MENSNTNEIRREVALRRQEEYLLSFPPAELTIS